MKILSGHFVLDADQVISTIKEEFERYQKDSGLVVLVFCPKGNKYYDQLIKSADFWNRYSDKYVTVLIPGYVGKLSSPDEEYADNVETEFWFDAFKEVYETIANNTSWKYSGGADIIATFVTISNNKLSLNYKNAISYNVGQLDSDGKFDLNRHIVSLINAAKQSYPIDPLAQIKRSEIANFIVTAVRSALPKPLREVLDATLKADLRRLGEAAP